MTIIFLFIITGCSNDVRIKEKNVIEVKINDIVIQAEDYKLILDNINKIHPTKQKQKLEIVEKLRITTNDEVYLFEISKNNIIAFKKNGVDYYSKNKSTIKKIRNSIEKLNSKYNNESFYTIEYKKDYDTKNIVNVIKIDNVSEYFIITPSVEISELQIHKVEQKGKYYEDIDSVYQLENIKSKTPIIIRMNPIKDYYRYRIKITNIYGMTASIIPTYDIEKESGELIYINEFKRE